MFFMRFLIIIILSLAVSNCGAFKADVDPVTGKKIRKEADLMKRGEDFAKEQGGIFNSKRTSRGGTTYDFATSNIIWRATLESLDFVPLQSANYH
jgi:YHS domain-containing protein